MATAFNIVIDDSNKLIRGFSRLLPNTSTPVGLYVQCLRKTATLEAVLVFGVFPRNKPVQAAIRLADGTIQRFGPTVRASPAYGFHNPKITGNADVLRLVNAAFQSGSLLSNGHNSIWNRIPEAANHSTATALRRCARSPTP